MQSAQDSLNFEEVYRTNVRFVWRTLRRLGVREADVLDATQEVFVVVHRKLEEFEGRSKIARWLFSICLRVASDRRRAAHARREVLEDFGIDNCPCPSAGLGSPGEQSEVIAQLEAVLDSLPMEQRIVLVLFELEGMTGAEIAEMLDTPNATIHSRLRLAREAFRRAARRFQATERFDETRMGGEP